MRSLHAHPEHRSEDFAQHSTCTADHIEAGMCGVGWGDGFQHPGPLLPGRASSTQRLLFHPHLLPFGFNSDLLQL